jgi:hypothetical protein
MSLKIENVEPVLTEVKAEEEIPSLPFATFPTT